MDVSAIERMGSVEDDDVRMSAAMGDVSTGTDRGAFDGEDDDVEDEEGDGFGYNEGSLAIWCS